MPGTSDPMLEYRMRRLLQKQGEVIAKDVSGDFPDMDTGFECYVYEIDGQFVGYIYMGDCGDWAFTFNKTNDAIEQNETVRAAAKQRSPYSAW